MRTALVLFTVLASASASLAEGPPEQLAQTTNTSRIDFSPNGTIRLTRSYGDLYIEGWDQPEVELTVIKSTSYSDKPAELKEKAAAVLDSIAVAAEKRSNSDLAITTTWAKRADWAPLLSKTKKNGVHLEYRLQVPRDAKLVIDHHGGSVEVGNVTGEIEASNRDGDIMLLLPASGTYAIDARAKMGHIASGFDGKTLSRFLVGQRFLGTQSPPGRRIHLRTGFGGITILALSPEGEGLSALRDE